MGRRLVQIFSLTLLLSGCAGFSLFPQHSEMREIHDLYRKEFAVRFLPGAGTTVENVNIPKETNPGRPFARTLSRIRSFQLRYPDSKVENAHLTVLEGMIYLQIGETASAGLLSDEIKAVGKELSGTGNYVSRDRLFAENFSTLVDVWKVAVGMGGRIDPEKSANTLCKALVNQTDTPGKLCGENIDFNTTKLETKIQNAMAEGDGGPIYIAATGAIAYLYADKIENGKCRTKHQNDPDAAYTECWKSYSKRSSCAASKLMGLFLKPSDRKNAATLAKAGQNSEHLRYLRLYAGLNAKCIAALAP